MYVLVHAHLPGGMEFVCTYRGQRMMIGVSSIYSLHAILSQGLLLEPRAH